MLLSEFLDLYLEVHASVHNKPSTIVAKRQIWRSGIGPLLGAKHLEALTNTDMLVFVARLKAKELSNKTINNQLTVLSHMLKTAQDMELIQHLPKIKRMKKSTDEKRALHTLEGSELLAKASEPWGLYMEFVLNTGLRIGELRALEWNHFTELYGASPRIHVMQACCGKWSTIGTPKGKPRWIPLNKRAVVLAKGFNRYHKFFMALPLLPEEPLNYRRCERAIIKARNGAGIKWLVGWHTLRHTFASRLAMRGVDLLSIRDLLGHVDISTTLKYSHLAPSKLAQVVAELDVVSKP